MNRRSAVGQAVNFSLQSVLSVFIKSPTWSVLSLVFRHPTHSTETMVQLHKASLVEPSSHPQKMLDLLDLTVSKDLVREYLSFPVCKPSWLERGVNEVNHHRICGTGCC